MKEEAIIFKASMKKYMEDCGQMTGRLDLCDYIIISKKINLLVKTTVCIQVF